METVKDYLSSENARNKASAQLYLDIIREAFGPRDQVVIGHHLSFENGADIESLNEIPSADTMIFDHAIMTRVFGDQAVELMRELASLPVDGGHRDRGLRNAFELRRSRLNDVAPSPYDDRAPRCSKESFVIEPRTGALLRTSLAQAYERTFSAVTTVRAAPDPSPEMIAASGRSAFDEVAMERWEDDGGRDPGVGFYGA